MYFVSSLIQPMRLLGPRRAANLIQMSMIAQTCSSLSSRNALPIRQPCSPPRISCDKHARFLLAYHTPEFWAPGKADPIVIHTGRAQNCLCYLHNTGRRYCLVCHLLWHGCRHIMDSKENLHVQLAAWDVGYQSLLKLLPPRFPTSAVRGPSVPCDPGFVLFSGV
jgi:hypothetical protein